MKRIIIVIILLSFSSYSSKGQLMFQRSLEAAQGLICYGMVPTSGNGFIFSGYVRYLPPWPQLSTTEAILIGTDSVGNLLWNKTYGGSGDEYFRKSTRTPDGNYVHAGYTTSYGPIGVDPFFNLLDNNIFLVKTDESGNIIWNRTYGDTLNDGTKDILNLSNGEIILLAAVNYSYFFPNLVDVLLLNIDSAGNQNWNKVYYSPEGFGVLPEKIIQANDGGFYIAGTVYDLDTNNWEEPFLMRTNPNGNIIWAQTMNIAGCSSCPMHIVQHPQNGVFFGFETAGIGPISGNTDFIVTHIDSMGNPNWAKRYGTLSGGSDYIRNILLCRDSTGLLFIGHIIYKSDLWGNISWAILSSTNFNNTDLDSYQKSNHNYFFLGRRQLTNDMFMSITQIDSSGNGCGGGFTTSYFTLPVTLQPLPLNIADSVMALSADTGCIVGTEVITDTLFCYTATGLGEESTSPKNNPFEIYPNPFENEISIKCNSSCSEVTGVTITDVFGKLVAAFDYLPEKITFNQLPPEMYIISVNTMTRSFVFKAIKIMQK